MQKSKNAAGKPGGILLFRTFFEDAAATRLSVFILFRFRSCLFSLCLPGETGKTNLLEETHGKIYYPARTLDVYDAVHNHLDVLCAHKDAAAPGAPD